LWPPINRFSLSLGLVLFLWLQSPKIAAEAPQIAELNWIDPEADAVAVLTTVPLECLITLDDAGRAGLSRLGRVAFRSPVLLGGIAARVGMRCDTCHRNGHGNPSFRFPGVSGRAGTADVTGSVFSSHREDGRRNPVPIPTLVDAGSEPPFGSIRPASTLREFILTAVVEEFEGGRPPTAVVDGLVEYVKALRSTACSEPITRRLDFDTDVAEVLATFDVMMETPSQQESEVKRFVLHSLRALLERVYVRFPKAVLGREELVRLSRDLSTMNPRVQNESVSPAPIPTPTVDRERIAAVLRALRPEAARSFYEQEVLRRALEPSR
jgi:hypothetical protein